ncbi:MULTISPECIES: hypothetical protein [Moorena]|uniref:hypothetical protein n=1 Tax=Moorena TaxID=1155738 RepID=UPI00142AE2C4|nr:hypothetical protein [Moorena sp. SIO4G3]NEO77529.1 hypothetical protein [Moorena sp. SIO4G3]
MGRWGDGEMGRWGAMAFWPRYAIDLWSRYANALNNFTNPRIILANQNCKLSADS